MCVTHTPYPASIFFVQLLPPLKPSFLTLSGERGYCLLVMINSAMGSLANLARGGKCFPLQMLGFSAESGTVPKSSHLGWPLSS